MKPPGVSSTRNSIVGPVAETQFTVRLETVTEENDSCVGAVNAAAEILVRTFYATRDTRTPVLVGVVAVLANVALGWALIRLGAGLDGLAIAFSTANEQIGNYVEVFGDGALWMTMVHLANVVVVGGTIAT